MTDHALQFRSPSEFPRGTIAQLLRRSYAAIEQLSPSAWEHESKVFDDFDTEVYDEELVRNCTFITTVDGVPVGLGSFDPRQRPAYGDIGHNCVLPKHQGKGYGKMQIEEIFRRFRERKIEKARVSTGVEEFFAPARAMYEKSGFIETRKFVNEHGNNMIEYERPL